MDPAIVVSELGSDIETRQRVASFIGSKISDHVEDVDGTGNIKLAKVTEAAENTGFYALGEANVLTNHIHRITCLSDIAYSLHIYSDDARKGVVYGI